ncbi:11430_t:CDS:2, partial [Entrophospora sp. SA101]
MSNDFLKFFNEIDSSFEEEAARKDVGYKFKIPVFQLSSRDDDWFMLSSDVASTLGFNDSYLLHLRNPILKLLPTTDEEKNYLCELGLIDHFTRSRNATIVYAWLAYFIFGTKIVHGGRRSRDDDISDHEDVCNILSKQCNLKRPKNKLKNLDEATLQHHRLVSVRDYNARLKVNRKEKPYHYDPHTNIVQLPNDTQSTYLNVEFIPQHRMEPPGMITYIEEKPRDMIAKLSEDILEIIPSDIRAIIEKVKTDEDAAEREKELKLYAANQYPLALMDNQIQQHIPIIGQKAIDNFGEVKNHLE